MLYFLLILFYNLFIFSISFLIYNFVKKKEDNIFKKQISDLLSDSIDFWNRYDKNEKNI